MLLEEMLSLLAKASGNHVKLMVHWRVELPFTVEVITEQSEFFGRGKTVDDALEQVMEEMQPMLQSQHESSQKRFTTAADRMKALQQAHRGLHPRTPEEIPNESRDVP